MDLELKKARHTKNNPAITIAFEIVKRLFKIEKVSFDSKEMGEKSSGRYVKKQLRCAVSGCFDKDNICCKECDIKKCRYKCNFIDREVCEHQYQ